MKQPGSTCGSHAALGRCRIWAGSTSSPLRLLAGWAVGTIGGFFLAFLGESGASVSTATQQLISDIWPVFGAAGCVSALGILVTLWDLLGPRFESLCIGEGGVAPRQDRDFNAELSRRRLLPMDELLAVAADSATARNPLGSTWAKQSYAFVHWGLYGNAAKNQRGFVTFVTRLAKEPLSEALFKECFKMSYREMEAELRSYVDFTVHNVAGIQAKPGTKLPEPSPFELRDATPAEIGRLTGDALRLAGHDDAAHLALIAPYVRGERDPQLLAAIGLLERHRGDDVRARKFLEAAVGAKAVRPRAYVELAQLRLAEAVAHPAAGRKLSADQAVAVLTPLFTAREQPPRLPEIYETIAEAWTQCVVTPTAAHLAVLDEGVRLFPRNVSLVYRAASLKVRAGFAAEADSLITLGLRLAPDGETRAKFEKLKASLPAPAVVPAPK